MTSASSAIITITLTVNDRTGVTLYAPPWEDDDGEEWQGFLGDGAKILLYPNTTELAAFITSGEENDLSDHPGWGQVLKLTPDDLKPGSEEHYDLDQVYEWAAGEPDPVHVSQLANVVDMVAKIADCCDDGALRRLVEGTPAYADLVDSEVSYHGRDAGTRSATRSPTRGSARSPGSSRGSTGRATTTPRRRPPSRKRRTRSCGRGSAPSRSRSCCVPRRTSPSGARCRPTPRVTRPTWHSSATTAR
jgi:hypothetical protein